MRQIEQKTIEKVVWFLTAIKQSEGKEVDIQALVRTYNLQKSAPAYARIMNPPLFDYKGKKILKVNYDLVHEGREMKVQAKVARDFVKFMNNRKKENTLKKKGLLPSDSDTDVATMQKDLVKEPEVRYITHPVERIEKHVERKPQAYRIKLFGVKVGVIEPVM